VIICAKCGHDNPQTLTFCERCDAFLEWNTAATTPATGAAPGRPEADRPAERPVEPPPGPAPVVAPEPAPLASSVPDRQLAPRPGSGARRGTAEPGPTAEGGSAEPGPTAQRGAAGSSPARSGSATAKVERDLALLLAKARERGRGDLVERLGRARRVLADRELCVVVAGEYKQGKSSLVNAIVKTGVCPVDDDIVTAVPTVVRYGERAEARIHVDDRPVPTVDVLDVDDGPSGATSTGPAPPPPAPEATIPDPPVLAASPAAARDRSGNGFGGRRAPGGAGGPSDPRGDDGAGGVFGVPIAFEDVGRYVRGELVPADATGQDGILRSVEVRLARQVLQAGLTFVDSPGVGGLESAEGSIVLGVLDQAEALLFVTDASQELTRAEISFLQAAVARCPRVVCVMTKTDLHADWRRMADLDRAHLARAGLDIDVVTVSSFLRMRAAEVNDAAMNAESGFPALFDHLRDRVVAQGRAGRLAQVADEIAFVAAALERGAVAESAVIARPEQAPQVMQHLAQATRASAALSSDRAAWQQVLTDGIQDLVANVDHELRNRLKSVVRSGEDIIARADPADSWSEFEAWLRRQVVTAAVETYRYLTEQAAELTERVGRQFDDDAGGPVALSISAPVAQLEQVRLGGEFGDRKGIRSALALSAARGSYGGMVMFGMAGTLIGYSVAAPVMVVLSLGLGRRALREERRRHHQQNQAQARAALQRYASEVGLLVDKECKDALRRTQRLLRDEFTARARSMHQSDREAHAAAERARRLPPTAQAERQAAASREIDVLGPLAGVAAAGGEQVGRRTSGGPT
jgi:GTP-binding protein EngB required for normal cell division